MTGPSTRRHAVLVTPYFPPAIGGVERYVQHLSTHLRRNGWTASVVTTEPYEAGRHGDSSPWPWSTEDEDALRIYRLPVSAKVSNTPIGRGWRRSLREILAIERPSVVNAHAPVPVLADLTASVVGDIPFVLTYHTGRMRKGRKVQDATLRAYERSVLPRTARRADRVICSSAYVADTFAKLFFAKSDVVQPGVDLAAMTFAEPVPSRRLLFVGSLMHSTAYKGLDDLLDAMSVLRRRGDRVELNVVGSGDAQASYQQRAEALGIADAVSFAGPLGGAALVDAYRQSALLVLPTRFDSMPTVLIEALAVGRPVVSTPVGEIANLLRDSGGGVLVPPSDPGTLADTIAGTLDNADLAAMGRKGHDYVADHLSWARQGQRTVDIFERAIRQRTSEKDRRVAVLAPYFAPHVGGVERYAERLVTDLLTRPRTQPVVVTTKAGGRTEYTQSGSLPVVHLGALRTISNTPVNPLWPLQLRLLYRRLGIDVVHAHSPVPYLADVGLLAAGRRRRTMLTYHSGSMLKGRRSVDWAIRLYENRILPRLFAGVDYLSASSASCLPAEHAQCDVWPPGVDVESFRPAALSPSRTAPTIAYVGRIEHASSWKGVDVLIDAFALVTQRIPDARLLLVGGGDAVSDHLERAAELGLGGAVQAFGSLSGDDLVSAYQAARVVVLPSLTEAESFGMTLIEAMACGRPVIGSAVGGIPKVIDDGVSGLLVPPGNVQELADACVRVLDDDALADRLGEFGRDRVVREFTWTPTLDRYFDAVTSSASARR